MTQLHVNKVSNLQRLPLANEPITIGRASSNTVVLPSKRVSREHCVIEVIGEGAIRVRDLGSRHGTTVNGAKVTEKRLGPGDIVGVGSFEITLDDPMGLEASGLSLAVNGADAASGQLTAGLERRRDELEQQVADLKKRLAAAEKRRGELEGKLAAARDEATRARETAGSETDAQRTRADAREAELAESRAEHERLRAESDAAQRELGEKLGAVSTELDAARATAEKADRQLAAQTHALEDALARAASLEQRVSEVEAGQREAMEESRATERSMARLREAIRELHAASERVTVTQENLAALEGLWLEADERLQESERDGDVDLAESLQRDAIGNHLEEAHAECDATVVELQEVALRLCRLIAADEASLPAAGAARTTGRRPSMFRRSSRA